MPTFASHKARDFRKSIRHRIARHLVAVEQGVSQNQLRTVSHGIA
jgi:hypothetical protein